jgi:hypothetical protein
MTFFVYFIRNWLPACKRRRRGEPETGREEPASGRGEHASGREEPASGRRELASGRGEPASVRGGPVSGRGGPASGRGGTTGRTPLQLLQSPLPRYVSFYVIGVRSGGSGVNDLKKRIQIHVAVMHIPYCLPVM